MPSERLWSLTPVEQRLDSWARRRLEALHGQGRVRGFLLEFAVFTVKQAWACVFGAAMLVLLVTTHLWYPEAAALSRSDALVIGAVAIQALMLLLRLESGRELWVIVLFHLVGTVMEIFKTSVGSWHYGGDGLLWIAGVPLYTGFMYAAVGSYMVRVFRLFDLHFDRYPARWATALLGAAVYANFFGHHYVFDARWVLLAVIVVLYARCTMQFRIHRARPWRRMPILAAFTGVAFFIWIAENIATAAGAWIYPNQADGWELVSLSKLVSWFLLMIISVVLVTFVYRPRPLADTAEVVRGPGHELSR
ncbi:membrane protein [Nocardiopsis terrae]|uniref:Uncharacterized membrane protein YoaT (DUF817 family) n=1 Tax=Nocardiopsis terrae TaxID=372655 RepID=A0ABR9HHM3_9ACTN|nr:DUF817 domain-containing protein [Nocardiopsis terrae]MBE1458513.1 uncharacterized membrane protein YoaT (DUF817 family) [Nocardiopsis terrae]GHC79993.1 membrane protein [Nocardiopsis terrae]